MFGFISMFALNLVAFNVCIKPENTKFKNVSFKMLNETF